MNRTYEDMSKQELITLVKRLTKQHDEWSAEAKRLREQNEYFRGLLDHYKGSLIDEGAEARRLRGLLDAANERARVAIESHPNADEMLKELIE